jgi:hypothetical protein
VHDRGPLFEGRSNVHPTAPCASGPAAGVLRSAAHPSAFVVGEVTRVRITTQWRKSSLRVCGSARTSRGPRA